MNANTAYEIDYDYEITTYEFGSGIYNDNVNAKKYRLKTQTKNKFYVKQNQIYENVSPRGQLCYLYKKDTNAPIINMFFISHASLKRYTKLNKLNLLAEHGKLGEDYFIEDVLFSHKDVRCT